MADNVSLKDTTQLELNCWVSSTSPHRILSIKLERTAKIASLKRQIRNAGSPDYDGLPVDSFRIYKNLGSVACGDDFSTLFPLEDNPQLVELQAETQIVQVLSYNSEKQLLDNHLHIIAQPPDSFFSTLPPKRGHFHYGPSPARKKRCLGLVTSCDEDKVYGCEEVSDGYVLPSHPDFRRIVATPRTIAADKTRYIERLDKMYEYYYLFLRPRRWGKSTFLQTLKTYYDKTMKDEFYEIFGDLYIGKKPTTCRNSLLVLVFDFSSIRVLSTREKTEEDFNNRINTTLQNFLEKNACFLQHPDISTFIQARASDSLANLLNHVDKCGERIFLGVDEYDAPTNDLIFPVLGSTDHMSLSEVLDLFKTQFFAIVRQHLGVVQKCWITGVLPVSLNSISPLLFTTDISASPMYHGLCGFTDREVQVIAQTYLSLGTNSKDLIQLLHQLKQSYGGYRLAQAPTSTFSITLTTSALISALWPRRNPSSFRVNHQQQFILK